MRIKNQRHEHFLLEKHENFFIEKNLGKQF